jgi:hypothetical protein
MMLNKKVKLIPTTDRTQDLIERFGDTWYLLRESTNNRAFIESMDHSTIRNVRSSELEVVCEKQSWDKKVKLLNGKVK